MAKENRTRAGVPDGARLVVEHITGMVEDFCRAELTEEYAVLGRKLTEKLARKRPSPLLGGWPRVDGIFLRKEDARNLCRRRAGISQCGHSVQNPYSDFRNFLHALQIIKRAQPLA